MQVTRQPLVDGVRLTVTGRPVPELRLLVASGRRMLLRQHDVDLFVARVDDEHDGVDLHRLHGWRSPVPPIRSEEAHRLGTDLARWSHWFADHLSDPTGRRLGPLHDGVSLITHRVLPPYVHDDDLVLGWPDDYLDWSVTGWNGAVPIRPFPAHTEGRVKAYGKLADDGVLPPVLLWRVSALDGFLVLDGHDRLAAALARDVTPTWLVLDRAFVRYPPLHLAERGRTVA